MSILDIGFEEARKINKHYGKSYYFATWFFPKIKRKYTYALYAFFRMPDEIVDNPGSKENKMRELEEYEKRWKQALSDPGEKEPIWLAIATTFKELGLKEEWGVSFLKSMRMDIEKSRYATFEELEEYMYGSAGVVGYFMAMVIGFKDPKTLEYAKNLGYGMQLANFLRDVKMDLFELGRIYIPQEDMKKFGVSEEEMKNQNFENKFKELIIFEAKKANSYFSNGSLALDFLNDDGKFAFLTALVLYREILVKLKEQDFNVWSKRASTNFLEKIGLCLKAKTKGYYDVEIE